MNCIPNDDRTACKVCGRPWIKSNQRFFRNCRVKGPGDYLHDAILKWVGEGPTRECGCTDRINQMNAWGAKGCKEHLEDIVDWMMAEASKRGWWALAAILPGSRFVVRQMVLSAIERAESSSLT